jgi:hypothetical protein
VRQLGDMLTKAHAHGTAPSPVSSVSSSSDWR